MATEISRLEIIVSTNADKATEQLNDLSSSLENVNNASKDASSSNKETSKSLKETGKSAKEGSNGLSNFFNSLKRIAYYRVIRSVIKAITSGIQDGMKNVYAFSKAVNGELATALDNVASASSTMKNQLGAAFASLVQAVAPALITLMNIITKVADVITQLIAAFTGTTYLKADDVAASWDNATDSVGAYKRSLMGFDELNVLNGSSGSGSSSSTTNSGTFTETPIDSTILEMVRQFKAEINKLGITEKLKKLKDAWDKLKTAVVNSGMLTWIGELLGKLSGFNHIVSIIETITDLLNLLADLINGDLYNAINSLWDLIIDVTFFLTDVSLGCVSLFLNLIDQIFGTDIMGWLRGVKTELKDFDISAAFVKGWGIVKTTWGTVSTWFKNNVINPIVSVFTPIVNTIGQIFSGLWLVVQAVWKVASTWFNNNVITPLVNVFTPIVTKVFGFFYSLWNSISTLWGNVANWFSRNVITPLSNAFNSLWQGIKYTFANGLNGIISIVESAINTLIRAINRVIGGFNNVVGWAGRTLGKSWGGIGTISTVSLSRVSFANGGFPEDGLFFANHNELVGQFDNGRTAVANNKQIIEGIKQGVYEAMMQANGGQNFQVNVDGKNLFDIIVNRNNGYVRSTGASPLLV